jgi:hypothetical protein
MSERDIMQSLRTATATATMTQRTQTMVKEDSLSGMNNPDLCVRCDQNIYPLERIGPIMNQKYHKQCFKCFTCDTHLDLKTYQTNLNDLNDRNVYCSSHNPKNGLNNFYPATPSSTASRLRSKSPGSFDATSDFASSNMQTSSNSYSSSHLVTTVFSYNF